MVSPPLLKFLYHIPDDFSIFTEVSVGVSERCDIETSVKMEKPSGM
jgi:hypothetical protein